MPGRTPKLPKPGEQLSARELRIIAEELSRIINVRGIPPIFVRSGGTFDIGTSEEPFFPAKITGGSNPYSWIEQIEQPGGAYIDKDFGLRGSADSLPAYEMNDKEDVPYGQIVWMKKAALSVSDGQEYQFWGDDEFPDGYYGNRQGRYCIDIEKQKCVDGVLIDDSISIHSNVPIWMSRDRCGNPTGQGGSSANPPCPPGKVDTSATTPFDCDDEFYKFDLQGIIDGTCPDCDELLNRAFHLVWNETAGKWLLQNDGLPYPTTCGQLTVILQFSAGYYELLIYIGESGVVYRINGLNWTVGGPNVLTLASPANPGWCNNFPPTITVT